MISKGYCWQSPKVVLLEKGPLLGHRTVLDWQSGNHVPVGFTIAGVISSQRTLIREAYPQISKDNDQSYLNYKQTTS